MPNHQPKSASADQPVSPPADQPVIDQDTATALASGLLAVISPTAQPVDPADTFRKLFVSTASQPTNTDADLANLLAAYRAIPGPLARQSVQVDAMSDAMRARVDQDRTLAVSDWLAAQQVTRTRQPAQPVDPSASRAARLASLALALLAVDVDGSNGPDTYTALAGLIGAQPATALVDAATYLAAQPAVPSPDDRQSAILAAATRAAASVTRGQSGPRGQVTARRADGVTNAGRSHVDQAMSTVPVGTFLSTGAMAKLITTAYPDANRRPSSGALANVVRNADGPITTDTWQGSAEPTGATRLA